MTRVYDAQILTKYSIQSIPKCSTMMVNIQWYISGLNLKSFWQYGSLIYLSFPPAGSILHCYLFLF